MTFTGGMSTFSPYAWQSSANVYPKSDQLPGLMRSHRERLGWQMRGYMLACRHGLSDQGARGGCGEGPRDSSHRDNRVQMPGKKK
jgi:hypothetical protein